MDRKRQPGNFILEIGNMGLELTASLTCFGAGNRVRNLANSISLSATLLSEAGREVNNHAEIFKDNFQSKFEGALLKCKKEYEQCYAAIDKVNSWKKDETDDTAKDIPKRPWKKLAWGLEMTDGEFSDYEDELEESFKVAMMAQVIVQLVILQVQARQRELTVSENLMLRKIKKQMGKFLEVLHETGVGSVMVFSLNEPSFPANVTQVAQASRVEIEDSASNSSITIRNPYTIEMSIPEKEPAEGLLPPPPPPPPPGTMPVTPYNAPDIFEMHRAVNECRARKATHTVFRFLGLPFRVTRTDTEVVSSLERVPISQDNIKAFMEKNKPTISRISPMEVLIGVSPAISTSVFTYLATKTDTRVLQSHIWTLECVLAAVEAKPRKKNRIWQKKRKVPDNQVIILRGESNIRPGPWGPSPRIGGGPPQPPRRIPIIPTRQARSIVSSISSRRRSTVAAKFELSQQETEDVVNDYIASFSTLYDGVPVELRGAALKAIVLTEKDDSDYDSDSSSSSGSSVDD
ncbi:unnamed protein product [Diplocarpon coronariae]